MLSNSKNIINLMWDRWYDSISMIYDGQKQMESLFLQSISKQKEVWEILNNQVDIYSNEVKSEVKTYQEKANDFVESISDQATKESILKIQNQLDNIVELFSKMSLTPQNALNHFVSENLSRVETNVNELMNQQAKNREEMKVMVEKYSEELKNTLLKLCETIEAKQNINLTLTK